MISISPIKSIHDVNQYIFKQLKNQLKILLISNPIIQKSTCSISVQIGTLADPITSMGLAHFLQHMLFMGSTKYPSPNQFTQFINKNGGSDNAETGLNQTSYYFEIRDSAFSKAVQMLSQFFKSPLLNEQFIKKQMQAVHEQFMQYKNDDNQRRRAVLNQLAKGQYAKFNAGNKFSLNHQNIRKDLKIFYDKYYSANIITAVLISNQSLNQLQKYIQYFQGIVNKNVQIPKFQTPFQSSQCKKFVRVQSIKDEDILQFVWVVENLKKYRKYDIDQYITHVLGHEGKNSLYQKLKDLGYITQLMAGSQNITQDTSIITLTLVLTEESGLNYEQIYGVVNGYVRWMRAQKWIFMQMRQKNRLDFMNEQINDLCDYSSTLSSKLHYIQGLNILNHGTEIQYNQQLLQKIIKQLNEDRLILLLSSNQQLANFKIQKYYGTKYYVQNLPTPKNSKHSFFSLQKNIFLPINIQLYPFLQNQPRKINPNIIYYPTSKFHISKGSLQLILHSPNQQFFRQIFIQWVQQMMKQYQYPAQTLGLEIQYHFEENISIHMYGYNDIICKMISIFGNNLCQLHKQQRAEKIFQLIIEKVIQNYQNLLCQGTSSVLNYFFRSLIEGNNYLQINQIIQKAESFTYKKFLKQVQKFWKNIILEWIVVGNFLQIDILNITSEFQSKIKQNLKTKILKLPCLLLSRNIFYSVQIQQQDIQTSGALIYYQYKKIQLRSILIMQIINQFIQQKFFYELRTIKQLAYQVGTSVCKTRGILGLELYLVSNKINPKQIRSQIRYFINQYQLKLQNLSNQQFNKLKTIVLQNLSSKQNSLSQVAEFIRSEVKHRTYLFNRKSRQVLQPQMKSIQFDEIVFGYKELIKNELSLFVVGAHHRQQCKQLRSESIIDIKKKNEFHYDYERYEVDSNMRQQKKQLIDAMSKSNKNERKQKKESELKKKRNK